MSADRHRRVKEVFLAVADLPRERWERELARLCGGDREVREEAASLLGFHAKADAVLDPAEIRAQSAAPRPEEDDVLPEGTRVAGYTIERLVGEGGMGHVYVAAQDRPRRTVALKVIRRSIASESLLRRFEHEAEMLGRLQHPGIAQIYEAGSAVIEPGRPAQPFIAMELVNGPTLTAFAASERLGTSARLELLAKVCDAVHHAHQRGVIHRDLKPANILVGADGQTKVLDFGVARAADAEMRFTTVQTGLGQLIGTLPYMSPEQVAGDPSELDTRSDVYALGVVLYELLSGRLPYEFKSRALPEAVRLIREQPPARLTSIDRALKGDVETIVLKALAKEKARRYQSAADLAADIRSHLEGRPISARQDSALYVLRTQIARHRVAVGAGVAMLLGLIVFAVYAQVQSGRNARLADAAVLERTLAERALDDARAQREEAGRQLASSTIERGRLLGLSGNHSGAEDLLWPEHLRTPNSRRSYFALWELYSRSRCLAVMNANRPKVACLAVSPDSRFVASGGVDPGVIVWDTESLEALARFGRSEGGSVEHGALAFSPAGVLASGDAKGRVSLWVAPTGREIARLVEEGPGVIDMRFGRGGDVLAAALADGSVVLLDARIEGPSGEARRLGRWTPPGAGRANTLSFDPSGEVLAVGCTDSMVRLVGIGSMATVREIENPDDATPHVAFSPDGMRLAVGGAGRRALVVDAASGEVLSKLVAPNGRISALSFTPDGAHLLTGGWWSVQVWELASGRVVHTFSNNAPTESAVVSPDGRTAWGAIQGLVRAWELGPEPGRTRLDGTGSSRTLARFCGRGEIIVGEGDGSVALVSDLDDRGASVPVATLGTHGRRVRSIALDPTRRLAAAVSVDGLLTITDLDSRSVLLRETGYRMATNDGAGFDSAGARLVLPAVDNTFVVLRAPDWTAEVRLSGGRGEALAAKFSPDDRLIGTTSRGGPLVIHDATTGEKLRECEPGGGPPWTLVFSPDGRHVLGGNWARSIDVWEVETGRLRRRLDGHRSLVTGLAFRPGEPDILASCSADGRMMLWDLSISENTPVLTLDEVDGWEVWHLDFDERGRRLMGTSGMGVSVIWDLRYFNRHMGGNMLRRIEEHREALGAAMDEPALREQRALLLSRGRKPTAGPAHP